MTGSVNVLCATPAFLDDWRHAGWLLQDKTISALGDLIERMATQPSWGSAYQPVRGTRKSAGRFLGVDLDDKHRLIVKESESPPVLFAMGDHDIKEKFQARLGEHEVHDRYPPPERIQGLIDAKFPGGFELPSAAANPPHQVGRWRPEEYVDAAWVYFLDDQQVAIRESILDDLLKLVEGAGWKGAAHVVVGGPGTGKTSILLEVLAEALRFGNLSVDLDISDPLREQIEARIDTELPGNRAEFYGRPASEVILIDDPTRLFAVSLWVSAARRKLESGTRPLVVISVDPLQLAEYETGMRGMKPEDGVTDAVFSKAVSGALVHRLTSCYRQKANVGKVAYDAGRTILEKSSAYSNAQKVRRHRELRQGLLSISANVDFPNDSGWAGHYPNATFEHWTAYHDTVRLQQEIDRKMGGVEPRGDDLLVVASCPVPEGWLAAIRDPGYVLAEFPYEYDIKGLEYKHVAVVAHEWEFAALKAGKESIGPAKFDRHIRPLRIAVSRARDSLGLFGIATADDE